MPYLRDNTGERVDNVDQIKDMTVAYFTRLLGSENQEVLVLSENQEIQGLHPYRCPTQVAERMTLIPSDDEIREAFFLDAWDIVGGDVVAAVKEFFTSGRMLHNFNAITIALIPKVISANELSKFRPVSCCSTIFIVIARLLKKRLNLIKPEAVQLNQVGFIKGRLLCENVLLASELVVKFHKRGPNTRGCLQIDLTKAYDNII